MSGQPNLSESARSAPRPRPVEVMLAGGGTAPASLSAHPRVPASPQPRPPTATMAFAEPPVETPGASSGRAAPPQGHALARSDPAQARYPHAAAQAPCPDIPMPASYPLAATAPLAPPGDSVPLAVPPMAPGVNYAPPSPALPGDGTYDVILEAVGSVTEQPPGTASEVGHLKVIQGQIGQNPAEGFFAFVSAGSLNVPLVASSPTHRIRPGAYHIFLRDTSFVVELDPRTEPELVSGFEKVLCWFTTWEDMPGPNGAIGTGGFAYQETYSGNNSSMDGEIAAAVQTPFSISADPSSSSKVQRAISAMDKGGNKGVEIVSKIGSRVNSHLSNQADKALAKQASSPPKEVKLGGESTSSALKTVKTVVGLGAAVAAKMIDKVANKASDKVASSKTVQEMRVAPVGSTKRTVHDLLVSGSVAIARVYLAADHQGRLICESAGVSASRVVGAKYGTEAANVTLDCGRIVVDTYRIVRFPTRLGATTLLKGAVMGFTGVDVVNNSSNVTRG